MASVPILNESIIEGIDRTNDVSSGLSVVIAGSDFACSIFFVIAGVGCGVGVVSLLSSYLIETFVTSIRSLWQEIRHDILVSPFT